MYTPKAMLCRIFLFLSLIISSYSFDAAQDKTILQKIESKIFFGFKLNLILLKNYIKELRDFVHTEDDVKRAQEQVLELKQLVETNCEKIKQLVDVLNNIKQDNEKFQKVDLVDFESRVSKDIKIQEEAIESLKNKIDNRLNKEGGLIKLAKDQLDSRLSSLMMEGIEKNEIKLKNVLYFVNSLKNFFKLNLSQSISKLYTDFYVVGNDLEYKMNYINEQIESFGNTSVSLIPSMMAKREKIEEEKFEKMLNNVFLDEDFVERKLNETILKLNTEGFAAVDFQTFFYNENTKMIQELILINLEALYNDADIIPIFIFLKNTTTVNNLKYNVLPSISMIDRIVSFTSSDKNLQYGVVFIDGPVVDVYTLPSLAVTTISPDKYNLMFDHENTYNQNLIFTLNKYKESEFFINLKKKVLFVYLGNPPTNLSKPKVTVEWATVKLNSGMVLRKVDAPSVNTYALFKKINFEMNLVYHVNAQFSKKKSLASKFYFEDMDLELIIAEKTFDIPKIPFSSFFANNLLLIVQVARVSNQDGKEFFTASSSLYAYCIHELLKNNKPEGAYAVLTTKIKKFKIPEIFKPYSGETVLKFLDVEGPKNLKKESLDLELMSSSINDTFKNISNVLKKNIQRYMKGKTYGKLFYVIVCIQYFNC